MATPGQDAGPQDARGLSGGRPDDTERGLSKPDTASAGAPSATPPTPKLLYDFIVLNADPLARLPIARESLDLALGIPAGQKLVAELRVRLGIGKRNPSRVEILFSSTQGSQIEGGVGHFEPIESDAPVYNISIKWQANRPSNTLYSNLPGNITMYSKRGVAHMASTVFHELLHVWYVRENLYRIVDPEFLRRWQSAVKEIDRRERA
jgi:hypothetical protein